MNSSKGFDKGVELTEFCLGSVVVCHLYAEPVYEVQEFGKTTIFVTET